MPKKIDDWKELFDGKTLSVNEDNDCAHVEIFTYPASISLAFWKKSDDGVCEECGAKYWEGFKEDIISLAEVFKTKKE